MILLRSTSIDKEILRWISKDPTTVLWILCICIIALLLVAFLMFKFRKARNAVSKKLVKACEDLNSKSVVVTDLTARNDEQARRIVQLGTQINKESQRANNNANQYDEAKKQIGQLKQQLEEAKSQIGQLRRQLGDARELSESKNA